MAAFAEQGRDFFPDAGVGHRITGDRSKPRRKPGWEYLLVCVDDNSRTAYTEMLPDEKATSATCFFAPGGRLV